jgi:hypothetical protein
MTKVDKFELAARIALISFWVFILGMILSNDRFQQVLLTPLGWI